MFISIFAFQEFYIRLRTKIFDDLIDASEMEKEKITLKSKLFWYQNKKGTKTPFFWQIFKPGSLKVPHHFQKIYADYKPEKHQNIYMPEDAFIMALNFLDYELPHDIKDPLTRKLAPLDCLRRARVQYQLFLRANKRELLGQTADELIVYDEDKNEIIPETIDRKSVKIHGRKLTNKTKMDDTDEKNLIEDIVTDFYNHIAQKKNADAWELISPAMRKKRWKDGIDGFKGFDLFDKGYANTDTLNNIHVFNIQVSGKSANCKVYYDDEVSVFTSTDLLGLDIFNLDQIEQFSERLKDLKQKAEGLGIRGLGNLEIHRLFSTSVSEYIWYKYDICEETLMKLLPSPKTYAVPRVIHVFCIKEGEKWLIKNFTSVITHIIR